MINTSAAIRVIRPLLQDRPRLKAALKRVDHGLGVLRHSLAPAVPGLIRPQPRQITIAITAKCNLQCEGCKYGSREFMTGAQLPLDVVRHVLDDAHTAGVNTARFYGGEPLLHPDLPAMIAHARGLGLDAYVTTNGTLLERRVEELFAAGLRWMTIGFYGVGEAYDGYTHRPGHFARLRAGLERARRDYGAALAIQLNFVLSRRSASLAALGEAWALAREFDLHFSVDPISETIPFFQNPNGDLHFETEHAAELQAVVDELLRLRNAHPERMPQSRTLLRALPDLLLRGDSMRVPCDAYELLWVGADGTVQLCDVAFPLGNVRRQRLGDLLFTRDHRRACQRGFRLQCPNCACKIDSRIRKHAASLRRYGSC
ncbi:MAG: radical SAM protein [Planctomycetota bacterium]